MSKWLRRLSMGVSILMAQVGWAELPTDDAGKVAQIEAMYQGYKADFASAPEISVAALLAWREAGEVVLVDVREPKEREVSMIPGAIPLSDFKAEELGSKKLVAYCTIGYRSGQWVEARRAEGVQAYNLKGSILSWTHAGQPLEDANGPTKRVHVYGAVWNLARHDYEAVW